jgi:xanthine dehydrogenase small subunit
MTQFILNETLIKTNEPNGGTVLDFVRYHKRLTGTKIGCREGDCGACTVLVGAFENNELVYRNMTSCLMPLVNAQGKHIVTVEGINQSTLSPVQQAMVDTSGTQCGFCTIGFVMSLTGFAINKTAANFNDAITAIDGNICRCTGYKAIERAAQIITNDIANKPKNAMPWLVENKYVPAYFLDIEQRLLQINNSQAAQVNNTNLVIAGGTDLNVQKHHLVKKSIPNNLLDNQFLKGISIHENKVYIGASVTVSEFWESSNIKNIFPNLYTHIKLVSSSPIRNMASLAGNLVNASPIGDITVFMLALDAEIEFNSGRKISLKNFYLGYKQTNKLADELITKIIFEIPNKNSVFNFEKVCKRQYLDIASVNTACLLQVDSNNVIVTIHLSAGGVFAYPKYLTNTVNFLTGKILDAETIAQAIEIMENEVAPISDARGSKEYKKRLLTQLVLAHLPQNIITQILHL